MKILVEIELRCRDHPHWEVTCDRCQLLRRREMTYQRLRSDRVKLTAAIRQSLAEGEFIIIDAR